MNPIISFHKVSHSYGTNLTIDDVSFDLMPSTITTLIGPNGAGKTTIAKLLLSLEQPLSGSINIAVKNIAYAPQIMHLNYDIPISAQNFIETISIKYKPSLLQDKIMHFMRYNEICNKQISILSGGQMQGLVVASALLSSADLIILDEPTQALDVSKQQEFYALIKLIRDQLGTTIFVISHDLFTVTQHSDQVLCLNHHICCKGTPTHTIVQDLEGISLYSHSHDHNH